MAANLTRGGFDVGLMTSALAVRNETLARNAEEAAEQEQQAGPAARHGGGGGGRRQQPGKIYTFGSGDYGRLGHGDNQPRKTAKLVDILRDKDIVRFACGPRHTVALAKDGAVYSWGYGGDGQLGHGDYQVQTMPKQIRGLQGEHVIDIACGEKHSAALTSGGDMYCWGDGSLGQLGLGDFRKQHSPHRVMELSDKMILQISLGAYHTACIDKDENVYTWGQGGSGRLGHDNEADLPVPTVVESLQGKGIQAVRCFHEHTMALTVPLEQAKQGIFDEHSTARLMQRVKELEVKLQRESFNARQAEERLENSRSAFVESEENTRLLQGQNDALLAERVELYMKVQNLENQLSVATTDKDNLDKQLRSLVSIPTKLEEISSQGIRQIAVGAKHVLALADSGDVYTWGTGSSGQLGLGNRRSYPSPQLVFHLMRKGVRQIATGDAHALALTYNGLVYSWGSSRYGQLGHGNRKTQLLPKMIEALDESISRERSSTVRLIGAGARHSVAVLGNGELYMWGRPDFGRLGRSKNDAYTEPYNVEALGRRDVAEGEALGKAKALGKAEIAELLEQKLDVEQIERYFPDLESDPEAALFLQKRIAGELRSRVGRLEDELAAAQQERTTLLADYVAREEEAFKQREKEGEEKLRQRQAELEERVEMHEKSKFFQDNVERRILAELAELNAQIAKEEDGRGDSLAQARTADKAALNKSLRLALDSLRQAKQDKEVELTNARRQAYRAQEELEQAQKELSSTRVDIRKMEKQGFKASIETTHRLVAQVAALSQRLSETSIEHIDPATQGIASSSVGLRELIRISNEDIDRISSQAAEFCSDDYVDVKVRQQLATLLFDNAEMRKQLNAYTEGILLQTMERLDHDRERDPHSGGGGGGGGFGSSLSFLSKGSFKEGRAPAVPVGHALDGREHRI